MSNGVALALGLLVGGFLLLDQLAWDGAAGLALARRGLDLIAWMAVWR